MRRRPFLGSVLLCLVIALAAVISSPASACKGKDSESALEESRRERAKQIAAQRQVVASAEQRVREARAARPATPEHVAAEEKRLAETRAMLRLLEQLTAAAENQKPLC